MNKRFSVRRIAYIALFTALTTICAWLSIPFGDIAFTMQTFAVFAAAGLLGARDGTVCLLVYLLLGAVGVPVFSRFQAGVGVLLGEFAARYVDVYGEGPHPKWVTMVKGAELYIPGWTDYVIGGGR